MLESIDYKAIQDFIDLEAKCGNKLNNKGLSPKSLGILKKTLSQIFKSARRDKLISDNPCEFVKTPKQIKREPNILTLEQLQVLLENIKDENVYPIIYLTSVYGLRRSEVLGIKWDSIDYENMTVTIKHTVVQGNNLYEKDSTKNESSYRTYPMSEKIKEIFLRQKKREEENKQKFGKNYISNDYVFKWDNGEIIKPDYVSKKLGELLEKNGLPHIRFHDLRHSCASYLASKGFQLKDIQEWLVHADIETTANIYAHLYADRKDQILTSMNLMSY